MEMVYLFNHYDVLENEHVGIRKKMNMQMRAFESLGFEAIYIVTDETKVLIKNMKKNEHKIFYFAQISNLYDFVVKKIKDINPVFVYMRYRIIYTPGLFEYYKALCTSVDKVICEFYTYPYDTEFPEENLDIQIDHIFSSQLHKFLKYSTNYNSYNTILGIQSINLSNGIELEQVPVAELPKHEENAFQMIGVATMFPWHGYDRIIEGIHQYYLNGGRKKVKFHIVGDGKEIERYLTLTNRYGLTNDIIFHGKIMNKERLNGLFNDIDLAIGSVGMHRLGLNRVSPIKSAEYCARGIPFVINYEDVSFEKDAPFIYKVSRDETAIAIDDLISFSEKYRNKGTSHIMREYAEKYLTWISQMRKVIEECEIVQKEEK